MMEFIPIIIFFSFILIILLSLISLILFYRCPSCKKFFSCKVVKKELLDKKMFWKSEMRTVSEYNHFSNSWEPKTKWETVPVYRYKYKYYMICKNCGHSFERIVNKES